jgi:hypothetical protein
MGEGKAESEKVKAESWKDGRFKTLLKMTLFWRICTRWVLIGWGKFALSNYNLCLQKRD